jgi:type IV pilus assembly protein PilE
MKVMQTHLSAQTQRGVTLMELLVTMVIVGVIAAIAIPSYQNYSLKAHRTEAKSALLDMASLEERFFSTNQFYSGNASDLGYPAAANTLPYAFGSGYYRITAITPLGATIPTATTPGTPATYSITVTYYGNQTKDTACQTFTITSAGQQTATDSANASSPATTDCWK